MILLDTDTVTLLASGHGRVVERALAATDVVATTIITRAEILRGRIEFLLKAADGQQVERAQALLELSREGPGQTHCRSVPHRSSGGV
jgi:tRNA(fMet)-specific endonuclease VapC